MHLCSHILYCTHSTLVSLQQQQWHQYDSHGTVKDSEGWAFIKDQTTLDKEDGSLHLPTVGTIEGTSCLQPAKTLHYTDSNIHPLSLCTVLMNTLQLPWFPPVVTFTLSCWQFASLQYELETGCQKHKYTGWVNFEECLPGGYGSAFERVFPFSC